MPANSEKNVRTTSGCLSRVRHYDVAPVFERFRTLGPVVSKSKRSGVNPVDRVPCCKNLPTTSSSLSPGTAAGALEIDVL
jgi:hypothetical protein